MANLTDVWVLSKKGGILDDTTAKKQPSASSVATRVGNFRWRICGLLFFATTLNYTDRQVLALLLPILQDPAKGIGLTQVQYGVIVSIFSSAYAVGLLFAGNIIDRIGTKKGYAGAIIFGASRQLAIFCNDTAITTRAGSTVHFLLVHSGMFPLIGKGGWIVNIGTLSGAVIGFCIVRFLLGFGEAGNFPAAIKAAAEWVS